MAVRRSGLGKGLDSLIPRSNTVRQEPPHTLSAEKPKKKNGKKASERKSESKSAAAEKAAAGRPAPAGTAEGKMSAAKETIKAAADVRVKSKTTPAPVRKKTPDEKNPAAPETARPETAAARKNASEENRVASDTGKTEEFADNSVIVMKISRIEPNRSQPRKKFDQEKIADLAESIRQYGVIQPLIVQKADGYFEIVAGERRWRAAKLAGLKEVPVIVRDYSEQEAVEISLIENIQREALNPIEEAKAYVRLTEEFHLSQENIAQRVSKSRAAVTNAIRLLKLAPDVQDMLIDGKISEGHARAILAIPDEKAQNHVAEKVVKDGLSVRDTEKLVRTIMNPPKRTGKVRTADEQEEAIFQDLAMQLQNSLGTKVQINRQNSRRGRIEIEYYSPDDLDRLANLLLSASAMEGKK